MIDALALQLTLSPRLITVALVSGAVGFALGYITASTFAEGEIENFRHKVMAVIILAWLLSVVAGILISSYTTHIAIHGMMGAIVGYLFGVENPISSLTGNHGSGTRKRRGEKRE